MNHNSLKIDASALEYTAQSGMKKILIFSIVTILCTLLLFSYFAQLEFKKRLIDQLQANAATVGVSIQTTVEKTIGYGFTLEELHGYSEFFNSKIEANPEINFIAVNDSKGNWLHKTVLDSALIYKDNYHDSLLFVTTPISFKGQKVGQIIVGISDSYMNSKLNAIVYDILTVMAISLLLTFEMILFIVSVSVSAPIASIRTVFTNVIAKDFRKSLKVNVKDELGWVSRSVHLSISKVVEAYSHAKNNLGESSEQLKSFEKDYIFPKRNRPDRFFKILLSYFRPTLFMIVFSEALSMSFFPLFVKQFTTELTFLPKTVMISLPISGFMLFWAISIPVAGIWSDAAGRKKPMAAGAFFVAIGFVFTALSDTLVTLMLSRAVSAVGYGMVYIAAQGFVADNTTVKNRTAGMASFISCFFSGALSGAAIGGVLVDRIGYRPTFYVSTVIALCAMVFALKFINSPQKESGPTENKFSAKNFLKILSNKKFLSLLVFSSIPAKICLAGYLYYIAPLFLNTFGVSSSSVGRFLIAYGLSMVVISPLSGRMADKTGHKHRYVVFGGVLAGGSLCVPFLLTNELGILLSILGLGLAHAVSMSSQLSLVLSMFKDDDELGAGAVIAIYRLIERLGNISGPLIAGVLIVTNTFQMTAAYIGIGVVMGAVVNFFVFYERKSNEVG